MKNKLFFALILFLMAVSSSGLLAATFSSDFNSGVPAGSAVFGSAVVENTGGVNNSGALKLTKAINSQLGSFIIDELDPGLPVFGFNATFKMRVGGGTSIPADGFSLSVGPDLPEAGISEEGAGTGLIVAFDIFDNGGGEAPAVDVKFNGATLVSTKLPISRLRTGTNYVNVLVRLDPDSSLDVSYNDQLIYDDLIVPGLISITGGRFGLGARTGGLNENQFVDDLAITTILTPGPIRFTLKPADTLALLGGAVTLSAEVNNPEGVTFQWFTNGVAVAGAREPTFTTRTLTAADDQTKIRVQATGPNNTVNQELTLTVVAIEPPTSPKVNFNFNDAAVPANAAVFGTAIVEATGGVNDSGVVKLTIAENSQQGSFIIQDLDAGAAAHGFAAAFKVRVGGGTDTPADGFSFNFANDLPDDAFGEEGAGTGLTVAFDIFDNGGGEAPAIDLKLAGVTVASKKVPISLLRTGDNFAEVRLRLNPEGSFDLAYNGVVVYFAQPVTAFSSISGGRFGLGARTGGLNENQFVDDLQIATLLTPGPLRITKQPANAMVLVGKSASFSLELNDVSGVAFQWSKNGAALAGATSSTLSFVTTGADNGAKLQVRATRANVSLTSEEVTLTVIDLGPSPQVNFNFNDGLVPANAAVFGSAIVDATGGVNDSGVLKLTEAINSQQGSLIIQPLEAGAELNAFAAAFKMRVGGGSATPADGFSFNYAANLPNAGISEEGAGSGLTVAFDIFDNGGGEAPAIDIKFGGTTITSKKLAIADMRTGDSFVDVVVRLEADATLDVVYNDRVIHENLPITAFKPFANGRFGLGARTGGLNENQFVDDLRISVTKTTGPLRITKAPAPKTVLAGQPASFSVEVNDPTGVAFQWFTNGVAVAGATRSTFQTGNLTLADSGTKVKAQASRPGSSATSDEVLLTVLAPIAFTPEVTFNFNDGAVPLNTSVHGNALVDSFGGVNDSGVLKLTEAVNSQIGSFIIDDLDAGQPVNSLVVSFKVRVGGGTAVPADGISFAFADDLQDVAFGEEGIGSGLVVSFDIFDNGGGEAPAIDVRFAGSEAASTKVPIDLLETGDAFGDVVIKLDADGTLDVIYDQNVIYHDLSLPNFAPITGGRIAFGGRTGGLNENQFIDDVAIATSFQAPAPQFSKPRIQAGMVVIEWTGGGVLQSASQVTGPWTDLPTATSPQTILPSESQKFFRVRK